MTYQIKDIIEYNGNCYFLDGTEYILDSYLDDKGFTSDDFTQTDGVIIFNTACRRGYVAIWKIENNKLFLCDIRDSSLLTSFRSIVFEDLKLEKLIHASWYTGSLTLIGLYDSTGQVINLTPPDISNVRPINHNADIELLYETDEEDNSVFCASYSASVDKGCISELSELNKSVFVI